MNNEIINALLTRRSVRSYKPQQVTDDELRTVLETGTYAPTSMGRQDPWIVAVQNAGLRQELTEMNAKVMGVDSDPYYGAPTIVLVFATKGARNAVQDASLALGNMMNAAHAIGLGSCWINRELEMFDTPPGAQHHAAAWAARGVDLCGCTLAGLYRQAAGRPQASQGQLLPCREIKRTILCVFVINDYEVYAHVSIAGSLHGSRLQCHGQQQRCSGPARH